METSQKIMDLQRQGFSNDQISEQLQSQGVSVSEISEGLNQVNIKNAISPPVDPITQDESMPLPPLPSDPNAPNGLSPEGYSVPPVQEYPPAENYAGDQGMQAPLDSSIPTDASLPPYNPNTQQAPGAQDYYPRTPQAYSGEEYYPASAGPDMGTTTEIVDQIVSEKFREYEKNTGDIKSFQTLVQDKITDLDIRLKNIESSIDKLSSAIIGKIGEFGQNSAAIHKDLDNLHGTVSKLMNPLMDNLSELKKISK